MVCKPVHGVGQNDADYVVRPKVDGKQVMCPYYSAWNDMLTRCYSIKYQQKKPTYVGCEVDPRWHKFMAFKAWMETQDWQGNQLDKDFLGNGKLYSPETCRFIPGWLNILFTDHGAARGELPLGVSKDRNSYLMRLRVGGKRVSKTFSTVEEAAYAYIEAKSAYVRSKYHLLDQQLIEGCERQLLKIESETDEYFSVPTSTEGTRFSKAGRRLEKAGDFSR